MDKKYQRVRPVMCLAALVCVWVPVRGQQPVQPQAGLESPWDVRQILANLLKDNQELQPLLARINPQQWYDQKGAPSAYISQWQLAQRQLADVVTTSKALALTARSLEEGAQKYADRTTSDRLSELIAHNFTNRQRFRDYIRDLAASTAQNFKIADEEAQRCRGMISKEPPPVSKRARK